MRRSALLFRPWFASLSTLFTLVGLTHAEPATPTSPAAEPPAAPARATRLGLSFLATAGYGASTNRVRRLELSPFGASFGMDAGFSFRSGFRLGAYFDYSLGRSVAQRYDPLLGVAFDVTSDASSLNTGLSLGYEVPLYSLLLRYSLGLGITSMKWDFGGVDARRVSYDDVSNPNVGFHLAPGAALLWPHGLFEGGIGFDYLVQTNLTIPNGFLGKVLVGVRL